MKVMSERSVVEANLEALVLVLQELEEEVKRTDRSIADELEAANVQTLAMLFGRQQAYRHAIKIASDVRKTFVDRAMVVEQRESDLRGVD